MYFVFPFRLQPSIYASQKKKHEGIVQHRWEMDIEPCLAIDFNIKDILISLSAALTFIHVPKKVNWEKFIAEGTKDWKYQMAVCDLFNERPVWIRQSLSEHLSNKGLSLGENSIKRYVWKHLSLRKCHITPENLHNIIFCQPKKLISDN
ncbi:putative transcription factor IIIC subunit 5, HTH domain-containing protein [Helianthus annuus]|nr:putative transcription factor IIIC subunit 5, HTH domain-containing protein [Helianthus annuus]